jgi:beta-ribofuranosylaminobenzene 5'-phosphate synthase
MSRVRVSAGARIHFGFLNLSLSHDRLYGSLGVAVDGPRTVVVAESADRVRCRAPDSYGDSVVREYVERAVERLGVPGASVHVASAAPRHAGLGSGTQLALSILAAVARAHEREPDIRSLAPALGRGGRSGIGVGAFERGGFLLDTGHPASRFTSERPPDGEWTVPSIAIRREIPTHWRFLLVVPDVDPGRNGDAEDESMRAVIERADPDVADRISGVVTRRLLPSLVDGDAERFGAAVARIGQLNGRWYADEQGGVYRSPVGELVDALDAEPACHGAGQSSWGPCVYAVTDAAGAEAARTAGRNALDDAGLDGRVTLASGRNAGADIDVSIPRND